MSGDVTIRWSDGEKSFAPGTEIRIGRDPSCDIVSSNTNVSRRHATVVHDGDSWVLRDQGSAQGVFKDGRRITDLRLGLDQSIALAAPQVGEHLRIIVAPGDEAPTRARMAGEDDAATVLPGGARPGGALRDAVLDSATVVRGDSLKVEVGGATHEFMPGREIVIGRDPAADVLCANPTVSRRHATISHDDEGWYIQDADSVSGLFVDGRRVEHTRLVGSTAVWLGDEDTGERLVIMASGTRHTSAVDRVRRSGRAGFVAVTAVAIALVAIGVSALAIALDNRAPDRTDLARGAVRIETTEGGVGSGTIIDAEEGLILTNAHVADPKALGQGIGYGIFESELAETPMRLTIWVSEGLDKIAEPRFIGEVVASDGYLDLAIVRITRTVGGSLVELSDLDDLVEVPLGDSDGVSTGDPIEIFGYPRLSQSGAATLTTGVVAGTVQDQRIASNAAYLNLDADIRAGNSGGLAADEGGRLIGVPTFSWVDEAGELSAMRPVSFAMPLIEAVRTGEPYASPYVTPLSGNEQVTGLTIGRGSASLFRDTCSGGAAGVGAGDREMSLKIDYEGFPSDGHQDLAVAIYENAGGRMIGFATTADQWPFKFDGSGCVSVGVSLSQPLEAGKYFVDFYLGPNYEFDEETSFTFDM